MFGICDKIWDYNTHVCTNLNEIENVRRMIKDKMILQNSITSITDQRSEEEQGSMSMASAPVKHLHERSEVKIK
jgi:hypothetical protein